MSKLNEKGQEKAIEQVELLTKIPEYRQDTQPGKTQFHIFTHSPKYEYIKQELNCENYIE